MALVSVLVAPIRKAPKDCYRVVTGSIFDYEAIYGFDFQCPCEAGGFIKENPPERGFFPKSLIHRVR